MADALSLSPLATAPLGSRAGVRAMLPVVSAYVPFALVVGSAVAVSEHPAVAWAATFTIYGGAAQVTVLDLVARGSGWMAAGLVALLVNARIGAYAAAMAPAWRTAPVGQRLVAALMLTDVVWGMARARGDNRAFYLGAGTTLLVCWPSLVALGALLHGLTGDVAVVALLPALTLGAIVVPQLAQPPTRAAAVAGACVALLTPGLDTGASLALAALIGVVAASRARRADMPRTETSS
jgi:predicted branched-subunit amino acid permease